MIKSISFYFFIMVFTSFSYFSHSEEINERIKHLPILIDGPDVDHLGYDNCQMLQNGEIDIITYVIESNDLVFDIGANIGEWSSNALYIQPGISLYAFEPVPFLFQKLESELMNFKNVYLSPLAISKAKGEAIFTYYPKYPGLSTLYQRIQTEHLFNMSPVFFLVNTERLDTFCKDHAISHINFVKIDTEGSEWDVLCGSENLLKMQAIDVIQFEYGGCYLDSKTTLKQIYDYLASYNYEIYRINSKGLIKIESWRPQLENFRYSNYLAVKK